MLWYTKDEIDKVYIDGSCGSEIEAGVLLREAAKKFFISGQSTKREGERKGVVNQGKKDFFIVVFLTTKSRRRGG